MLSHIYRRKYIFDFKNIQNLGKKTSIIHATTLTHYIAVIENPYYLLQNSIY